MDALLTSMVSQLRHRDENCVPRMQEQLRRRLESNSRLKRRRVRRIVLARVIWNRESAFRNAFQDGIDELSAECESLKLHNRALKTELHKKDALIHSLSHQCEEQSYQLDMQKDRIQQFEAEQVQWATEQEQLIQHLEDAQAVMAEIASESSRAVLVRLEVLKVEKTHCQQEGVTAKSGNPAGRRHNWLRMGNSASQEAADEWSIRLRVFIV